MAMKVHNWPWGSRTVGMIKLPTVTLLAGCLFLSCSWIGCRKEVAALPEFDAFRVNPSGSDLVRQIELFCGDCHTLPRPEAFPRDRWPAEVRIGYEQYARSGRNDLAPPPIAAVINYYCQQAPEKIAFSLPEDQGGELARHFLSEDVDWNPNENQVPAVSGLLWSSLEPSAQGWLIVSDMREGTVRALAFGQDALAVRLLAHAEFPCRVERCDLDGSGRWGFVIADLGSFFAVDHDRGKVLWLKPSHQEGAYETVTLASRLGRIDDVRVADFDGDGDQDILVAEFGHYHTGGILFLEQQARSDGQLTFVRHRLDLRTGTIHVPVFDFNGDNRPDFVALISNESESLDLFVNLGKKKFLARPIWRAPDLTFGSSGIELSDLDGDGDQDILYTNGDTFDNLYANPSHGLQWLENIGANGFQYHRLVTLPGAYRALAADLDGDGDQDIVLSSWLSRNVKPANLRTMPIPSVLLLEQINSKEFRVQVLDRDWPQYPVLEVADLDGDGDLDIVAGRHVGLDDPAGVNLPRLRVWWNQKVPGRKPNSDKPSE